MTQSDVKIDFNLIPEPTARLLIKDFVHNYEKFWADPANEAEFQKWRRKRQEGGDAE